MSGISNSSRFGKLNSIGHKALFDAWELSNKQGNRSLELLHLLYILSQRDDNDLYLIFKYFRLDEQKLMRDLNEARLKLPTGTTSISDVSHNVESAIERGWVYASLKFGSQHIRTGHLLIGIFETPILVNHLIAISEQFRKINAGTLLEKFLVIVAGAPEGRLKAYEDKSLEGKPTAGGSSWSRLFKQNGELPLLDQYTFDLTEAARNSDLDTVVGREDETRQIISILLRRNQNSPILLGEAGVGKTAIVDGLAMRIVQGEVPSSLSKTIIRTLDLNALVAGTNLRGDFEARLKYIVEEIHASEKPIILFIDEAHTLIGAGGHEGTEDAATYLKPYLAKGTLRIIAATTWLEYKKYFERDPGLTRRFQTVKIDEPSEEKALLMTRSACIAMEKHHNVLVLNEALEASVRLSIRYLPERQLPDKAINVLDTACTQVALSLNAVPPQIEDCRVRIEDLRIGLGIIEREVSLGNACTDQKTIAQAKLVEEQIRLNKLEAQWQVEKSLVSQIHSIRAKLSENPPKAQCAQEYAFDQMAECIGEDSAINDPNHIAPGSPDYRIRLDLHDQLKELQHQLRDIQGEHPLVSPEVGREAVASVISEWTGIPLKRIASNEVQAILNLGESLNRKVLGQRHALDIIVRRIQTARVCLEDPGKPMGVFLLCGSSGVGKTETAMALAEALYGDKENLITLNMGEYQEAHAVSTLKGSPPGYIGSEAGGFLTEEVRRKPYSVILLDEFDKANPDVHKLFYQVFDKGWMADAQGNYCNFKNTIILLTSNAGTEMMMELNKYRILMPEPDELVEALHKPLLKVFPSALLGRLEIVPYYPLSKQIINSIIHLHLSRTETMIKENHGLSFSYDEAVVQLILGRCFETESGARIVDSILTNTLLPTISQKILAKMALAEPLSSITVSVKDKAFTYQFE